MKTKYTALLFALPFALLCMSAVGCSSAPIPVSYIVDENEPLLDKSVKSDAEAVEKAKISWISVKHENLWDEMKKSGIIKIKDKKIYTYGELAEVGATKYSKNKVFTKSIFTKYKKKYVWNGYVRYNNTDYNSRFYIGLKRRKNRNTYTVESADCGQMTLTVHQKYGDNEVLTPLKMFTATDGTNTFVIYITQDKNWKAFGAGSNDPAMVAKYMPKTSVRELIQMDGQKMEIFDITAVEKFSDKTDLSTLPCVGWIMNSSYELNIPDTDSRFLTLVQTIGMIDSYRHALKLME